MSSWSREKGNRGDAQLRKTRPGGGEGTDSGECSVEKEEDRGATRQDQRSWTLGWEGVCVRRSLGGRARAPRSLRPVGRKGKEGNFQTVSEPQAEPAPGRSDSLR